MHIAVDDVQQLLYSCPGHFTITEWLKNIDEIFLIHM